QAAGVVRRAILGRTALALPGLARLVDRAEVTREHARGVVLLGVGCTRALAGGRIAGDLVALVQRREAAVLGLADAVADVAHAVDLAEVGRGAGLTVVARGSLGRRDHDAGVQSADHLPGVADGDQARRRLDLRAVHTAG